VAVVLAEVAVLAYLEFLVVVSPLEMLWRCPSQSQKRLLLQLPSALALHCLGRRFPSKPAVLGRRCV
jgi:hypothetical protein